MTPAEARAHRVLHLIAVFKLCKALLLIAVGLGALRLVQTGISDRAEQWVAHLASSSDRGTVQHLLALASGMDSRRLEAIGLGAFLYAALFLTEAVGLWLGRRWAEYLTVIATASLVPVELYHLIKRMSLAPVAALVLNLTVVGFLIFQLRRRAA